MRGGSTPRPSGLRNIGGAGTVWPGVERIRVRAPQLRGRRWLNTGGRDLALVGGDRERERGDGGTGRGAPAPASGRGCGCGRPRSPAELVLDLRAVEPAG